MNGHAPMCIWKIQIGLRGILIQKIKIKRGHSLKGDKLFTQNGVKYNQYILRLLWVGHT